MDNVDLQTQKDNLFRLIETWDVNNIKLALQLIKKNPALQALTQERYLPIIQFTGGKTMNGLKTLPKKFADRKLYRKDYNFTTEQLHVLQTLPVEELDLYRYKFKELPEWMGYMSQLKIIGLSKNELKTLPDSIGNLSSLEELYLHNNNLQEIPTSIGQLEALQFLTLDGNPLETLPSSIGQLSNLKTLRLSGSLIKKFPKSIGELKQLEELKIHQYISFELPNTLGALHQLKQLAISCSKDAPFLLPESIGQCINLESISFNSPQLNQLPDWVRNLTNLKTIRCNNSNLKELPDWIGELKQLELLSFRYNPLEQLPSSINQLTRLTELNLNRTTLGYKYPDLFDKSYNEGLFGQENIQDFFLKVTK